MKKKINISVLLMLVINIVFSSGSLVYATTQSDRLLDDTVDTTETTDSVEVNTSESTEEAADNKDNSFSIEASEEEIVTEDAPKELKNIREDNKTEIYEKYVTIISDNYIVYDEISGNKKMTTKDILGKTFFAKEKYTESASSIYISLFDSQNNLIGYTLINAIEEANGRQGIYQPYGEYVTITHNNYTTYSNFGWTERGKTHSIYGKTFQARGKYEHINGLTYLSLFDSKGDWFGYVNEKAVTIGNGRQGIYQSLGKFATITNSNYSLYNNFSWSERGKSQAIYGKTLQARGKYEHFNGLTYLSLYDQAGKWYGYINENATKVTNNRQGIHQNYNKYVTITNNNYSTYRNFSWLKLNTTKSMYGNTFHARGKYEHFNGLTYLSLFDSKGNWYGYVNERAARVGDGKQGIYQSFNRHVIINSRNYDMWQNFDWKQRQKSSGLYNKGYIAKGKYEHFNGATYYSIYDGTGKWQGYINSTGTKLVSYYEKPTTYYSQMSIKAYYGCAATSLYTALKAKGYARNVSLVDFINGLPLSNNNPDVGQIGDPWGHTPFKQVISPIGLNKYARDYTTNTEILTGSSTDRIITEINSGNLVLFWGRYLMAEPGLVENPQHVMVAKGYKVVGGKEYILVQDPGLYRSDDPRAIRWFEKNAFDNYLTKKYRKMMVIR